MPRTPVRYRSTDEDSARWTGFPFRDDDVVISTRSKSGTTWAQMICALLIFQNAELPAPLGVLSPWLDFLAEPKEAVWGRLASQEHRRFIKTHTPLDGIPLDEQVTYLVVARDPLDMAVSLYHQGDNIDRDRMRTLTGNATKERAAVERPPLHDWLLSWIHADSDPRGDMDSLPGVFHHLVDAWERRHEPNVHLLHYSDLTSDLEGQMRWLAGQLAVHVADEHWPELVRAATFDSMRGRASRLIPGAPGVLKEPKAFFRRGSPGAGREVLSHDEAAAYEQQVAAMAPQDLNAWLHRGRH